MEIACKNQYLTCNGIVLSYNVEANSLIKCEFERILRNSFSTERSFTITQFVCFVLVAFQLKPLCRYKMLSYITLLCYKV